MLSSSPSRAALSSGRHLERVQDRGPSVLVVRSTHNAAAPDEAVIVEIHVLTIESADECRIEVGEQSTQRVVIPSRGATEGNDAFGVQVPEILFSIRHRGSSCGA